MGMFRQMRIFTSVIPFTITMLSRWTPEKGMVGKKQRFFSTYVPVPDLSSPLQQNEDRFICRESFFSTGIFQVPFSLGIITTSRFELRKERLTEDAAKKQAIQRLYDYEEKLIEKGVQISENNVKIEINHQDCVSRGTLTVIERTGREAPTEKKTDQRKDTEDMFSGIIELYVDVPADRQANIFGQFDEHLKLIERTLNVTMIFRDGSLKILGSQEGATQARAIVEELNTLAGRGNTITQQNVNYAFPLPWRRSAP